MSPFAGMRRLAVQCVALAALACSATAATAQREAETGTRFKRPKPAEIPDKASMSEAERGRAALDQFGTCLVETNRDRVTSALQADSDDKFTRLTTNTECLRSGMLRFSADLLRGALYASLYRRDYGDAPVLIAEQTIDFGQMSPATIQPATGMLMVADCVLRKDLKNARDFVVLPTGAVAETAAFVAIRPHLGPCVPAGQEVALSKNAIEGALAEALYRQSIPARADRSTKEAAE